jgi:hypothetical protein
VSRFPSTPTCSNARTAGRSSRARAIPTSCSCRPARAGTRIFAVDATRERIAGVTVLLAALPDVIRSKEALNRLKDLMQLPILRQTLEEIRSRERRTRDPDLQPRRHSRPPAPKPAPGLTET